MANLSRFRSNLGPHHWKAVKRVLKYLKGTMDCGITYSGESPILEGYSDASWIINEEENSSTSCWVFVYGRRTISRSSKKQTCIADSIMAFEFIALTFEGKEAEWSRDLMFEIPILPMPISPIAINTDCRTTLVKAYS